MKGQLANPKIEATKMPHRYSLSAPVVFYWPTQNGLVQRGEGITRDIDTGGAHILADRLPPQGALIQVIIELPALSGEGSGAHLTGEGFVLQVESPESEIRSTCVRGFAVAVQFVVESSESVQSHLERSGRVM